MSAAPPPSPGRRALLGRLRRSLDVRDGALMSAAMLIAGGFDYLTNLTAGRRLEPAQFGALVSVIAILQLVVYTTNVIRNVTAYYSADLLLKPDGPALVRAFFARHWRRSWVWGGAAGLALAPLAPLLARWLQLDSPAPLWAASLAVVMLFVRPITDGALQGVQQFRGLATVHTTQAALRFVLTVLLIGLGWQAFGALLALPLASAAAGLAALYWLRPYRRGPTDPERAPSISLRYSTATLVGLLAFALLVNMDAILVKRLFSPDVSGQYGAVVTLGKINLFVPLALGMVLFPKSVTRQSQGRAVQPLLLLSLGAALAAGLALTALCFLAPGPLTAVLFGGVYGDPGRLLGWVSLATTLFAAVNIWLNYALAVRRNSFLVVLALLAPLQALGIWLWHDTLQQVALCLVASAGAANLAGIALLLRPAPATER